MSQPISELDLAQALGYEAVDKRIDILRRIGEVGSISEAARGAGVSYKAAWQAIETLSNLAGQALVEKAVGGTGGGGAILTQAGKKVLEGAALLAQARACVVAKLGAGNHGALQSPGLAGLGLRTSMRNYLPCRIQSLKKAGSLVRVVLDLGEGNRLISKITQESAELLGLTPGMSVVALCKATGVAVAVSQHANEGVNVLTGQVTRMGSSKAGELSLQLPSGHRLVGFATANHGLKIGAVASALIEESAVVIALTD